MSIIDAFDDSKPLCSPADLYTKIEKLCDVCVFSFKDSVRDAVLERYSHREVARLGSANGKIPIYYLEDLNVLFYLSPIGAANAGAILQEASYVTGATKFVVFGSCGVLDEVAQGKIIVPNEAYRDEGVSYHYKKPEDFIRIKNADVVERILDELNVEYVSGKTWTTDAFYMETENKVARRRTDGCICVEMEASGMQAIADYLNIDLYVFFFAADLLLKKWERGNLGGDNEKACQWDCLEIALRIAERV